MSKSAKGRSARKASKPKDEADVAYGVVCKPGQTIAPDLHGLALDKDGHTHAYVRLHLPLEPGCAVALLGDKNQARPLLARTAQAVRRVLGRVETSGKPQAIPRGSTAVRLVGVSRSAEQIRGGVDV